MNALALLVAMCSSPSLVKLAFAGPAASATPRERRHLRSANMRSFGTRTLFARPTSTKSLMTQ